MIESTDVFKGINIVLAAYFPCKIENIIVNILYPHQQTMTCSNRYNLRRIRAPWHAPLTNAIQSYSEKKSPENQIDGLNLVYSIISNHIYDIIRDGDDFYINSMILQHQEHLVQTIKPQIRTRSKIDALDDLLGLMVNIHMRLSGV